MSTTTAYIAGPLGVAIFDGADGPVLMDTDGHSRSVRSGDWNGLRLPSVELVEVSVEDVADLQPHIQRLHDAHDALTHLLIGLDPIVKDDTAALNIEVADELLADEDTHAFVRNRLLSRPAPDEMEIERGLRLARMEEAARVLSLYLALEACQPAIQTILSAWNAVAAEYGRTKAEQADLLAGLTEAGVFADLAEAVAHNDLARLDGLVVKAGLDPDLRAVTPRIAQLVTDLRTRVWEAKAFEPEEVVPLGPEEETISPPDPVQILISELVEQDRSARARRNRWKKHRRGLSGEALLERVNRLIARITGYLRLRRGTDADQGLIALLKFHRSYSEREHAAKSLNRLIYAAKEAGDYERAGRWSDYAKQLGTNDPVVWNTEAETLKAMGRLDDALAAFERNIERFPHSTHAFIGRAEILRTSDQLDDALAAFEQAIERFPSNPHAITGRAEVLKDMGRHNEALAAFDKTLERFPQSEVAACGRAEVLKAMGRYDEAFMAFENAIEQFPTSVYALTGRAEVLKAMGRHDESLAAFESIIERFPTDRAALSGRAALLVILGRYDEAVESLPQTMTGTEADWTAFLVHALAFSRRKEMEKHKSTNVSDLNNRNWSQQRHHFARPLSVARIMEKRFSEVLELLGEAPAPDAASRQIHDLLETHAHAGLNDIAEAKRTLPRQALPEPGLIEWRDALKVRYHLNGRPTPPSPEEIEALDQTILDQEIRYALTY